MERKKLILLIVGGILAVMLIAILIVGISDGIWPWDGPKAYGKIIKEAFSAPAATEPSTEPPTEPSDEEPTGGEEATEPTGGNQENTQPTTNPVIEGEPTTGGNNVQEEVVIPGNNGNTGNESGGNDDSGGSDQFGSGDSTGSTGDLSDADSAHKGTAVPGWGN